MTMQGAMWAVFAASLGAAAFLSNRPMQLMQLADDDSTPIKDYRLPRGWAPVDDPADDASVIIRALEPADDTSGRSISIHVLPIDRSLTPAQFLARNRLPTGLVALQNGRSQPMPTEEIKMVGQTGLITGGARRRRTVDEEMLGRIMTTQAYFATAILPQRLAVMVSLQGTGQPMPDDLDILRRVAQSIELKESFTASSTIVPPAPEIAESVTLTGGTRITLPAGFVGVDERDANKTARAFVSGPSAVLELVPCTIAPSDTNADKIVLAELHDSSFHGGTFKPLSNTTPGVRQWQILPAAGTANPAQAIAYLAADPTGAAVLAVIRGDLPRDTSADAAWRAIVAGLTFGQPRDVATLTAAGERVADRVKKQLARAPGNAGGQESWWLWFRDGDDPLIGWSSAETGIGGNPLAGLRQTRWRNGDLVGQSQDRWERNAGATAYSRQTTTDVDDRANDTTAASSNDATGPRQQVRLVGGRLSISWTVPTGSVKVDDRVAPANFLPGPVLEGMMNRLGDEPILIRTDYFPGHEPSVKGGLLSVLIEPSVEFPRQADDHSGPLRCVTASVNGSGQISRWYFHADGTIAQIDFANGLHRSSTTETELENSFGTAPGMWP
jgi:hypothetical protein